MGKYIGELLVKVDNKPLAYTTSCSVDMSTSFQETTNKDSGDFEESTPSVKSWNASGDGLMSIDASGTKKDATALFTAWNSQTLITVVFSSADGVFQFTGTAYIEKLSIASKTKDTPTYNFSLKGSGVPTIGTTATFGIDTLVAAVLSPTSLSLTYNATGAFTKVGIEASADGATSWAAVGTDITAAPYKSYQILTVAAGTKYYRAWVSDVNNVKVYSNTVKVTV